MSGTAARRAVEPLTRQEAVDFMNSLPYLVCTSSHVLLPRTAKAIAVTRANYKVKTFKKPPTRFSGAQAKFLLDPKSPIVRIEYEVFLGQRSYKFEEQPFWIVREISKGEYLKVLPNGATGFYYYIITTD